MPPFFFRGNAKAGYNGLNTLGRGCFNPIQPEIEAIPY